MRTTIAERRASFRRLHETSCFVIPNPWDLGSAVILQSLGFKALASTSSGLAWSHARRDNTMSRDEVLRHLSAMVDTVDLPVNADFENAFGDHPDEVAVNVSLAIDTGIAGISVEDSTGDSRTPLYDFSLAVERIQAARGVIDKSGHDIFLTARSEGFFVGRPDLNETLRRLSAYSESGADCLYAPGLAREADIEEVVKAMRPKPVNVLTPGMPVARLAALGARRISVGGWLARAAWGEFMRAAKEIAEEGTFEILGQAATGAELNGLFAKYQADRD
jgi:2-methylisocitrate lyase-like PEP mutase family enzyme